MEVVPQRTDDASKPTPKRQYSQLRREGPQSSWTPIQHTVRARRLGRLLLNAC